MEGFLFIPPVDDSLGPLKRKQWFWLSASFLASIALIALAQLTHGLLSDLLILAIVITALPMQIYAQNRKGRIVGKVFVATIFGIALYDRWDWIKTHTLEVSMVTLVFLSVVWLTWCIAQAGDLILKRMDVLQRRVNSVESKLDHIERTLRKTKPETEEVKTR